METRNLAPGTMCIPTKFQIPRSGIINTLEAIRTRSCRVNITIKWMIA